MAWEPAFLLLGLYSTYAKVSFGFLPSTSVPQNFILQDLILNGPAGILEFSNPEPLPCKGSVLPLDDRPLYKSSRIN